MAFLGNIGNFYVVLLFGLLLGGVGSLSIKFSRKIWSSTENMLDKKGGKLMNRWLKLAAVSLTGLLVASFALGFTNSAGFGTDASTGGASAHLQHGGQQGGIGVSTGTSTGTNTVEAQMYMMQTQILQLQQQLSYMQQKFSQQSYYPGPMGMPGNMNQAPGMNNMGGSMSNQSSSGGNGGAGMGMM